MIHRLQVYLVVRKSDDCTADKTQSSAPIVIVIFFEGPLYISTYICEVIVFLESVHLYFPLYLYLCRISAATGGDAIVGGAKPAAQPLQFLRHHSDASQQIVSYRFVTYNSITIYFHI